MKKSKTPQTKKNGKNRDGKRTVNGITSHIMTSKDEIEILKDLLQYPGSRLSDRYF